MASPCPQGAWDNNGMADFHTPVGGAADEAQLQQALEAMLQVRLLSTSTYLFRTCKAVCPYVD